MTKKILWIAILALIGTPSLAQANFGFHAGSHISYGKMSNATLSLAERTISVFDLQFMPGYRPAPYFLIGWMIDYRFVSQNADPNDLDFNDVSGRSLLMGPGISFEPTMWKFLVSYDLKANHSYTYQNTDTTYKGHGLHILFGYEVARSLHFDFEYVKCLYNSQKRNDIETEITENKVNQWQVGFGLSYSY